jgi:hypothetical protein
MDSDSDSRSEQTGRDRKPPSYLGGDGSSPEQAVVIRGASSSGEGVNAEYEYIRRKLGQRGSDWQMVRQSLTITDDGRYIDQVKVRTHAGETVAFYFDVSGFHDER